MAVREVPRFSTLAGMAQLLPSNFEVDALEESEKKCVRKFLQNLDEGWIVIPAVPITVKGSDREIDIVLINQDRGVFLVEVKGGIITLDEGTWRSNGVPIKNPAVQVNDAKYALLRRLKSAKVDAGKLHLEKVVAFPDIVDFPEQGGGPDCPREMVFTKLELDHPAAALDAMAKDRSVDTAELHNLIKALRPDIDQLSVDGSRAAGVTTRILQTSSDRLGPVIGLDENIRVYLRGSAGTGKTFVAMRWFRRALLRGESTLYVCFNAPLAGTIRDRVEEIVGGLDSTLAVPHMVGNFHAILRRMLGEAAPAVPPDGSDETTVQKYWNEDLPTAFLENIESIPWRFDTVIIDEAQDFRPAWLSIIERLMHDREHGRLYMMADSKQTIYFTDWLPPTGATTLELTHNVRNSGHIGEVVRRLGGAPLPQSVAPGPPVQYHRATGMRECIKAVKKSIAYAVDELGIPLNEIAVLVPHRATRDAITEGLANDWKLTQWRDRDEDTIICETVHRTKGLERLAIVLVDLDDEPDSTLAYVGASRASVFLSVVGKDAFLMMTQSGQSTA